YVSDIHYHYWLNFEMPIFLIAHIPNNNQTYWLEINKQNFTRTKKRWKLIIPFKNRLTHLVKKRFLKIINTKHFHYTTINHTSDINSGAENIFEIIERSNYLND